MNISGKLYLVLMFFIFLALGYSCISHGAEAAQVTQSTGMSGLLDTLNGYLKEAERVVIHYAPKVWEATLLLIRLKCGFFAILLVLASTIPYCFNRLLDWKIKPNLPVTANYGVDKKDLSTWQFWIYVAGTVLLIPVWVKSFSIWLGLVNPELYVLYQLATKFGLL